MKNRSVYPASIFVELVIAKFVVDKKHDGNAASDANCKADDIYERESLVSLQVSKSYFKIILQHTLPPIFNDQYQ
ncbi:MAG TPA: hypothetical protein VLX91_01775 [Candidatus Acidoferrales bacterium]|nr:hypothetical protein [Candidatus Acidoferrales bacterium]